MASLLPGSSPVYLVDLACYKPPEELRVRFQDIQTMGEKLKVGGWAGGGCFYLAENGTECS
jgi:hypothetical protein